MLMPSFTQFVTWLFILFFFGAAATAGALFITSIFLVLTSRIGWNPVRRQQPAEATSSKP